MIEAKARNATTLAARLSTAAQLLAQAHAKRRFAARIGSANRWRNAALLWPLFSQDT